MMLESFWIAPDGTTIGTGGKHIDTIIQNPEKFGLTLDRIRGYYEKHGEPLGVEGKAREEIIGMVLRQGWIRIREYRNRWSMTVHRLDQKTRMSISKFADLFVNGKLYNRRLRDKYAEVSIVPLAGGEVVKKEFHELASYALVESKSEAGDMINENLQIQLLVVDSAADLPDLPPIPEPTFLEQLEFEKRLLD